MDPILDKQIRLVLEQQTAKVFDLLYEGDARKHGFTLLGFDFGKQGHVAFKSNLRVRDLAEMALALTVSFSGGMSRYAPRGLTIGYLRELGARASAALPAGVGYAIIVGNSMESAYVSNCQRADMVKMLENELIPNWLRDAADPDKQT